MSRQLNSLLRLGMMAAECEDRGGPIEEASMEQIAEVVSVLVLEALVAEAAFVAEDEGAVRKNMAEVSEVRHVEAVVWQC